MYRSNWKFNCAVGALGSSDETMKINANNCARQRLPMCKKQNHKRLPSVWIFWVFNSTECPIRDTRSTLLWGAPQPVCAKHLVLNTPCPDHPYWLVTKMANVYCTKCQACCKDLSLCPLSPSPGSAAIPFVEASIDRFSNWRDEIQAQCDSRTCALNCSYIVRVVTICLMTVLRRET